MHLFLSALSVKSLVVIEMSGGVQSTVGSWTHLDTSLDRNTKLMNNGSEHKYKPLGVLSHQI